MLKAGGLCLSHSHLIKILLSRTHPDPTPRSGLTHQTSWVILSELNQHQHSTYTIILIPWLSSCRGWSWQNHFTWDYIPRNIHFNIHQGIKVRAINDKIVVQMRKENNELSKPVFKLQNDSEIFSSRNLFRGALNAFAQLVIYWMTKTLSLKVEGKEGDAGR